MTEIPAEPAPNPWASPPGSLLTPVEGDAAARLLAWLRRWKIRLFGPRWVTCRDDRPAHRDPAPDVGLTGAF